MDEAKLICMVVTSMEIILQITTGTALLLPVIDNYEFRNFTDVIGANLLFFSGIVALNFIDVSGGLFDCHIHTLCVSDSGSFCYVNSGGANATPPCISRTVWISIMRFSSSGRESQTNSF